MLELFKRIAGMILVSSTDDHMRNHGFLYAGNSQWRLLALVDVNPSPDRHQELKTAISEISVATASVAPLLEQCAL
ncbi:MAG: HipA domain-containing protein [Asticcacaulis sp.]|uniref:HipA domain-containing protein n=1 Tax=Asticcacaulis sp. TaxID=1872648 RepID=UPI003F7BDD4F